MCGRSLGSIRDAIVAASTATTIMSVLWVGLSWLIGMTAVPIAILFGAAISGAVAHRTGGRGFFYQAIASLFTITSLALSDAIVVRIHWLAINPDWPPGHPLPALLDQILYQAQWDGILLVAVILGLIGGFWLWR